jgi:hypothetical protein
MLTPTLGVTQNMPSIQQKINTPKTKEICLLVILQKQKGVIEKGICSRSIEKCAPIKEHRQKKKKK